MGPFPDYRRVTGDGRPCCGMAACTATRDPAALLQVFLSIVEASWDTAELLRLRKTAGSALL